jgi:hypothetical protein
MQTFSADYPQLMTHRVLSALVVVGALVACAAAQAATAATRPVATHAWSETRLTAEWVGPLAGSGSIRPRRIRTLASGPSLIDITWSTWTRTGARGHGYVQACPGCGSEHGDAVEISVLAPREFGCGDPSSSIGHWFSKIRVVGAQGTRLYRVYQDGHPNAC